MGGVGRGKALTGEPVCSGREEELHRLAFILPLKSQLSIVEKTDRHC